MIFESAEAATVLVKGGLRLVDVVVTISTAVFIDDTVAVDVEGNNDDEEEEEEEEIRVFFINKEAASDDEELDASVDDVLSVAALAISFLSCSVDTLALTHTLDARAWRSEVLEPQIRIVSKKEATIDGIESGLLVRDSANL